MKQSKKFPLKLNIQYFADGDNPSSTETPAAAGDGEPANTETTNTEVVTQKSPEEIQTELLSQFGLSSGEELQALIDAKKEAEEAGKSDLEKAKSLQEELQNSLTEKEGAIASLQANNAALIAGVAADSIADVVALAKATGKEDINEAIADVVAKYPIFKGEQKTPAVTVGSANPSNTNPATTTKDAFLASWK